MLLSFIVLCFGSAHAYPSSDWLVTPSPDKTTLTPLVGQDNTFRLSNGLISRDFLTQPGFLTLDLYSHEQETSLLRALAPEALITVGGAQYSVGGVLTDLPRGYLNRTDLISRLRPDPASFRYRSHWVKPISSDLQYKPKRGAPGNVSWPPRGLHLGVAFKAPVDAPDLHKFVAVTLHYHMYDGIPLMAKWVEVALVGGGKGLEVGVDWVDQLHVNWDWSKQGRGWLHVETDQPHGTAVEWKWESGNSRVAGARQTFVQASWTPSFRLKLSSGRRLKSFRVLELVTGTDCRERAGLARRRMMRTLSPWVLENPIFFHMVDPESGAVRKLFDQMAEVGFEMMIYSFSESAKMSSFHLESTNKTYIKQIAADIAYAHNLGIEVGGYDLIALTRRVRDDWMAVNDVYPSACMASAWYDHLLNLTLGFMDQTGLSMVETDGPYGGYTCNSTDHKHHKGLDDSVYQQNRLQADYYKRLRNRGVYINQPDTYYMQGGNKAGMGYSEDQFSLPRWEDLSISRQTIYDNTFVKPPAMGWMFLPLVQYHAGGDPAVFEPLAAHLAEYRWGLAQYLGGGVAACYRGTRIYDTNHTRDVVKGWVSWYKQHREVLGGDIVHVVRPNMQGLDSWLHVNPEGEEKGLLMVFNPTGERMSRDVVVPLYYTGISQVALLSREGGHWRAHQLDRQYKVNINVNMPRESITWYIIKEQ